MSSRLLGGCSVFEERTMSTDYDHPKLGAPVMPISRGRVQALYSCHEYYLNMGMNDSYCLRYR